MSIEETVPKFEDYSERIVAFIDLQGFSKSVSAIGSSQENFERIAKLLWRIKTMEDREEKAKTFRKLSFPKHVIKSLESSYECTALSDSIIFSYSATEYPEYAFVFLSVELAKMQWTLLCEDNFLIRGHITQGKCYHKSGIIFGQAYLDAYNGAEKNPTHKLPYITIQDGLLEKAFSRKDFIDPRCIRILFQKDHLQRNFINYAGANLLYDPDQNSAEKARQFINTGFEKAKSTDIRCQAPKIWSSL